MTVSRVQRLNLGLIVIFCAVFLNISVAVACCGCRGGDCGGAAARINRNHADIRSNTESEFDDDLEAFEDWMIDEFFTNNIVPALRRMTTQMSTISMQHAQIVGSFLDAKNQMDTQRVFQALNAEAIKDYMPSDEFCWFGTNVKSMAPSSIKAKFVSLALSKKSQNRQLGTKNDAAAEGVSQDINARWNHFRTNYCDPAENNRSLVEWGMNINDSFTGLHLACDHDGLGNTKDSGADKRYYIDKDVDFTKAVELKRTLDVDLSDGDIDSDDEMAVLALHKNLYAHKVLHRGLNASKLKDENAKNIYYALRSVVAKRGVAEYAFQALIGLKSSGTLEQYKEHIDDAIGFVDPLGLGHSRQYLAAIVKDLYPYDDDLGCPVNSDNKICWGDIYTLIGFDPSYFSQLEIMAKKMYQNPDFYVKLYDTPANISRKTVAMKAIELMVDREMYESQLRKEMIVSVLLSSKLRAENREVNDKLQKAVTQ